MARKIAEDEPVAVAELGCERLELTMRQAGGVNQDQRAARAVLAIGDTNTTWRVEEPKPHSASS
jgi:hypothetical protein